MILEERHEELQKHIHELSMHPDLLDARPHDRPRVILEISRMALNLGPTIDISSFDEPTQEELLVVIGGIRDIVSLNDGTDSGAV